MVSGAADDQGKEQSDPAARLRIYQDANPYAALGRAVSYMMTKPSFAAQPFGMWSRILTGQVNRKHYFFVLDGERAVGFVGWALTTEDKAKAWMANRGEISSADSRAGDCFIINAWGADNNQINRYILQQLRPFCAPHRLLFAKRFYRDGRTRPVELTVNEFLAKHR
ncbi:MAG: toxin-activating lysine-acyltransferase [Pseudomonadota bacterium]